MSAVSGRTPLPAALVRARPVSRLSTGRAGRSVSAVSAVMLAAAGILVSATGVAQATTPPPTPWLVAAWGSNSYGQTDTPSSLSDTDVTAVAAGYAHSLALDSTGQITAWGWNDYGQTNVPAAPPGTTYSAIAAGWLHNLALDSAGHVTAWGYDGYGETNVPSSLDDATVTAIAAGPYDSLALDSTGQITGWGEDDYGQADAPAAPAGTTWTAVAAGQYHTVALDSAGHVTVWGDDSDGQTDVPAALADKRVVAIAAGLNHSLALTADGALFAWGDNGDGETTIPTSLAGKTVTAISAGTNYSLALDSTGHVTAWGNDGGGQREIPAGVAGKKVTALAAGAYHVLAIEHTPPSITTTGFPTVTGTPIVGDTMTGDDSSVTTDPTDATRRYQWLRDGTPIDGATGATYTLVNDDAGHGISFEVKATEAGYTDAVPPGSTQTDTVTGGQITLASPEIGGYSVVGRSMWATLPTTTDPSDAQISWQWFRHTTDAGLVAVGDGTSNYTPTAADAGHLLSVTATAAYPYFDTTSQSTDTNGPIADATFDQGPAATISGTEKVGQTLTAGTGTIVPTPEHVAYQWYADNTPITGGTGSTLLLTPAQRHTTVTVRETASRAGYTDASDTSAPTADVATELAPDLSLTAGTTHLRRGQSTDLTWSSTDADTLTASGAWTGTQAASGSARQTPTTLGENTYTLSATNGNGTTTSQVTLAVTRPAARLGAATAGATQPGTLHLAGRAMPVTITGLEAAEPYRVVLGGVTVATGTAPSSPGPLTRTVTIPASAGEGMTPVVVTGSQSDRTGATSIRVVRNKTLGLHLTLQVVRTRHLEHVTITGLAPGEHLTMRYRRATVTGPGAHADSTGTYHGRIRVGRLAGTKTVTVTGVFPGRNALATFQVRRH